MITVNVEGTRVNHDGFLYHRDAKNYTLLQFQCKKIRNCTCVILLSSFYTDGLNLAFIGNSNHSHYTVSHILKYSHFPLLLAFWLQLQLNYWSIEHSHRSHWSVPKDRSIQGCWARFESIFWQTIHKRLLQSWFFQGKIIIKIKFIQPCFRLKISNQPRFYSMTINSNFTKRINSLLTTKMTEMQSTLISIRRTTLMIIGRKRQAKSRMLVSVQLMQITECQKNETVDGKFYFCCC